VLADHVHEGAPADAEGSSRAVHVERFDRPCGQSRESRHLSPPSRRFFQS
jgi:hypothetical protein